MSHWDYQAVCEELLMKSILIHIDVSAYLLYLLLYCIFSWNIFMNNCADVLHVEIERVWIGCYDLIHVSRIRIV